MRGLGRADLACVCVSEKKRQRYANRTRDGKLRLRCREFTTPDARTRTHTHTPHTQSTTRTAHRPTHAHTHAHTHNTNTPPPFDTSAPPPPPSAPRTAAPVASAATHPTRTQAQSLQQCITGGYHTPTPTHIHSRTHTHTHMHTHITNTHTSLRSVPTPTQCTTDSCAGGVCSHTPNMDPCAIPFNNCYETDGVCGNSVCVPQLKVSFSKFTILPWESLHSLRSVLMDSCYVAPAWLPRDRTHSLASACTEIVGLTPDGLHPQNPCGFW